MKVCMHVHVCMYVCEHTTIVPTPIIVWPLDIIDSIDYLKAELVVNHSYKSMFICLPVYLSDFLFLLSVSLFFYIFLSLTISVVLNTKVVNS